MNAKKQMTYTAAYDIQLLFPVLFLVGIGIVMVYSASSAVALRKFGSDYMFLKKQALFALAGIIGLVICRHFPYRWYRRLTYPLLVLALLLLDCDSIHRLRIFGRRLGKMAAFWAIFVSAVRICPVCHGGISRLFT